MSETVVAIRSILERYKLSLLDKKNVIGVGIGNKYIKNRDTQNLCLVIYVANKEPISKLSVDDLIPSQIETVNTDIKEIGKVKALNLRTHKWRPTQGGISLGHGLITAGTLGMKIETPEGSYVLSNNHVLAAENKGEIGDIIYQPGPIDSVPSKENEIGVLFDYEPLRFETKDTVIKSILKVLNKLVKLFKCKYVLRAEKRIMYNKVDAALCRPLNEKDVSFSILDIGIPGDYSKGRIGTKVMKSGRTTSLTRGEIIDANVTIKVQYGHGTAIFENQILTTAKSAGGDSGSVLLEDSSKKSVIGLLFAGSDKYSICNHIEDVRKALNF